MSKKTVYYWSPCLNKVGTVVSTINSIISLAKYSNEYQPVLINVAGEWDEYIQKLDKYNIKIINLSAFSYIKLLPKKGFLASRFSYVIIILFSFIPLIRILKSKKIDFFICQLITSLPLIIFQFLNLNTNLILRISGYPKLHFIRKFFWKIIEKKIFKITTPTIDLKKNLISHDFDETKILFLPDAILSINELPEKFNKLIEEKKILEKKYIFAAGRLTNQKNFSYLINEYSKSEIKNEYNLVIAGEGEKRSELLNLIKQKKLNTKIFLIGYKSNIFPYMKKAEAFVLSSKWEEVGFVMIEAAICNLFVIASDCPNGPREFLSHNKKNECGILFKNNSKNCLAEALNKFIKIPKESRKNYKFYAKRKTKKFTVFGHYVFLKKVLDK